MPSYRRLVTKLPMGIAIALGCCVGAAVPARADPDPAGGEPNPFGAELREKIDRGIRAGLPARLPGLPGPGR